MRKLIPLTLVPLTIALFFSCASGPQLSQAEKPDIAWEQNYEYTMLAPMTEDTVSLNTLSFKKDAVAVRVLNIRTGELLQELTNAELMAMAKEAQAAAPEDSGISKERIFKFPSQGIQITIPEQRAGLVNGNSNKPIDDIVVSELSSGKELFTITRKGYVFDLTVTDDGILLFYTKHIEGSPNKGALVKHSLNGGKEEFVAEVSMKLQYKIQFLVNLKLSGSFLAFAGPRDFNYSGIIVDGDVAFLSSNGISAVDLKTGEEIWSAENDTVTGEVALQMTSSAKASGQLLGKLVFVADIDPTPITFEDKVIYRNVEGKFFCVDKRTGKEIWSKKLGWAGPVIADDKGTMYVSLGLDGYDGNGAAKFNGKPGFAAYNTADGSELWSHKFKDPVVGMADNADKNGLLIFSGLKILDLDFTDGKLSEKLDIKKDWGIKKPPISFDNSFYDNEALLFFDDRIVWVDAGTAEKTGEFAFGMSVKAFNFTIGYSLYQINNSLLLEIPKNNIVYLFVLNDNTKSLRYFEEIQGNNYIKYPAAGMYLLGKDKRGKAGAAPAASIAGYIIK